MGEGEGMEGYGIRERGEIGSRNLKGNETIVFLGREVEVGSGRGRSRR